MIAGRTVLGLGGESMIVAATTVLAKWFKGKELSFAFGIKITISRMASVAADNSPTWANKVFYPNGPRAEPSWQGPLLLAVGAGVHGGDLFWDLLGARKPRPRAVRTGKEWVHRETGFHSDSSIQSALTGSW